MTMATMLEQGRTAYGRQKWADAYSSLSAADREEPLQPEDLERLATSAYLVGKDAEGLDLLVRLHNEYLKAGQTRP
ncbi:MAG: DNA-binding response regulator, partial [Gemmatimonadaceae bacterium]